MALDFVLAEVLVENVIEKFLRNGVVGLGVQDTVDLLQDDDVIECGLAEKNFAGQNIGFRKAGPLGGDFDIAFFQRSKAEQDVGFNDREKIFGVHDEIFGKAVKIFFSAAVLQQFEQAGDAADAGVGKHLVFLASGLLRCRRRSRQSQIEVGLRHDFVDVVDQLDKTRRLTVAWLGNFNGKIGAHPRWIPSQHNHAVRQQHRFFDIVRDDENGAGRHFLAEPELEQFIAQVFGREHVEGGERFIHEQNLGLDD